MKLDLLAVGAHPDDIELSCSGTLFHHISKGYQVGLLDLTRGELGTRGNADLRLREAEDAKDIFEAVIRENAGLPDGFFQHNEHSITRIIQVLRTYQPEIVLTNSLHDRHPDHGRSAKLVADACYYSGLVKIVTKDKSNARQKAWRPRAVYHYVQDYYADPDLIVDITPYMDKKIQVIQAFKSQFFNPQSDEPDTPISSREFLEFIKARARQFGRLIGVEFAEGFVSSKPLAVDDLLVLR